MFTEKEPALYSKVFTKDSFAEVFYDDLGNHLVKYYSVKDNKKFFEEEFKDSSIEKVEHAVLDWANGKRDLV